MLKQFLICGCGSSKKITLNHEQPIEKNEVPDSNIVKEVNLCIDENGKNHNTSQYFHMKQRDNSDLVIRRGQPFIFILTLSKKYSQEDDINFIFHCSDMKNIPNYREGTLVIIPLTKTNESIYHWKATLEGVNDNVLTVQVTPPPDCIISKWNMEIELNHENNTLSYELDRHIYIIFNPWCREDQVYMDSEEWREEAVLNSDGLIWRSLPPSSGFYWKYSQFEQDILECALYLISDIGKLNPNLRHDAVYISRTLSAVMNANDDSGVLVGNWSNKYSGGTPPTQWTGSRDILQQYYKNKEPVKYGQCWVFAGILTSVCRALGLPARTVTNFDSAHDQNGSVTIDYIVDDEGKVIKEYDSIWNFHVWSEVWMERLDLGPGYGGWQALDATPQEESFGQYRCGPSSVFACKNGDINKPYDLNFVFSEVNADMVYWNYDHNKQQWKLLQTETRNVGKNISTKAPHRFERLDITDNYKFVEGSKEERATYLKAMRQVDHVFGKNYVANQFKEVNFKFEYRNDITIGQNFNLSLIMTKANDTQMHQISVLLRLDLFSYTGKFLQTIKQKKQTVRLEENLTYKLQIEIMFNDYKKSMIDNCIFVVSCMAEIVNTDYYYFDRDNFQIKKPNIKIAIQGTGQVGEEILGKVYLKNPLPVELKKGKFLLETPGINKQIKIDVKKNILPGEEVVQEFKFVPKEPGRQTVAAKFASNQLQDVEGFMYFVIDE